MVKNNSVSLVFEPVLKSLNQNGRACEVCGEHMHDHSWALLDENGFVIYCSIVHEMGKVQEEIRTIGVDLYG